MVDVVGRGWSCWASAGATSVTEAAKFDNVNAAEADIVGEM